MDINYEEKYHILERKQWWFCARRDAIKKLMKQYNRGIKILDIGCSSGILMEELQEMGFKNLYGIDISQKAVDVALKKGIVNCFVMNGEKPEFSPEFFDLIISSDSLEHMEHDDDALNNWFNLLKPRGKVIVFVPAFMKLWSIHDEVNHHYRRYTRRLLNTKLITAGFSIDKSGYWNSALFFPVYLIRTLKKMSRNNKQQDDLSNTPKLLNVFLLKWMKLENMFFNNLQFPVGVSTYSVANKPAKQ